MLYLSQVFFKLILAKIAAQKAVASIFGGVFSQGGEVGDSNQTGFVQNFAMGGIVNGKAIQRAMSHEGRGVIPIVAHRGEYILSTRNGNSQLFQALQRSGKWREIKRQNNVPNFALGGVIGGSRQASASYSNGNQRRSSRGNVTINNTYNTTVADANQMGKTQEQLIAEAEARNARIRARNS